MEAIEPGIRCGVRKVNVDTVGRMAMSGAMRNCAREHPEVFDPRNLVLTAMAEFESSVRDRCERSGTAGRGASIRVIPLPEMAERYEENVLDPRVAAA